MTFNEFPSSTPLTLNAVKIQFDHWRATRVKGSKTPKYLWEAVRSLTKHHTYSQIATELKINPHRLQAKIQEHCPQDSKTDFIEVPLLPLSSPHLIPPLQEQQTFQPHALGILEVTRPDGTTIKASGLNHQDLFALTKGFLGA
jgi:hypothetical protein